MEKIVISISQPLYFPWCGFFDQIKQSDIFIHYNDVQFSKGFYNRVQAKTPQGSTWLTVPLKKHKRETLISECEINYDIDWITKHRKILHNTLSNAPYFYEMIQIFDEVISQMHKNLDKLTIKSIECIATYLNLDKNTEFLKSSDFVFKGKSSHRLLEIVKEFNGHVYISAHGGLNYLNHTIFENHGIEVRYMNYNISQYTQNFGEFTPYLSCLDAIAHLGQGAGSILKSTSTNWEKAIERPEILRA